MEFCKYHPLDGATHRCHHCAISQCDRCVDDTNVRSLSRCFLCGNELESLGAANTVEPFWRRLPEAFRYPLNSSSMSLIIIVSFLSVVATLMPYLLILSLLMVLFSAGSLLKYSFICLERTALGDLRAPDVINAYQGGITILLKLLLMIICWGTVVFAAWRYVGAGFGGFIMVVAVIAFPAMLIRFAQTENVLDAINPVRAVALVAAIGLPYGVLMAFILIMMSSVGVLHELIDRVFPAISYLLQSIISNYYIVVIFHIMGYMIFQFQGQLGFTARDLNEPPPRTDMEQLTSKIDVFLKEGNYENVVNLYYTAFKLFPNEMTFFEKYFELLSASKKNVLMKDYGTDYLAFLIKKKRFDKLTTTYKRIVAIAPDFIINTPEVRIEVALLFKQQGDLKLAAKLIHGMHTIFPQFSGLVSAYTLLADILDELPSMQVQANKCREWIRQHQHKTISKTLAIAPVREKTNLETLVQSPSGAVTSKRLLPNIHNSRVTLELLPMESDSKE